MDRVETARQRLKNLPRGARVQIARDTGLTYIWLSRFALGDFDDCLTRTLDKLEGWLDENPSEKSTARK